jgi:hypothetical protein
MLRGLSMASLLTISAFAPVAKAQEPVTPAPPKSARVSGAVVDANDGRPLRRAVVCFGRDADSGYSSWGSTLCNETDTRGGFTLANLPPSRYKYSVSREGYFDADPLADGMPSVIELKPGDELGGIKLRMQRAGSILGHAMFDDGEPFPGAELQLAGRSDTRLKTSDSGEYRFDNLRPGDYQVQAIHLGALNCNDPLASKGRLYVPQTAGVDNPAVHVSSGQEARGPEIILVERTQHRISGRVAWDTYPLPNVWRVSIGSGNVLAKNSDGSFVGCNMAPGEYTLRTFARVDGRGVAGDLSIRVDNEDLKDLEIKPEPSASIRARVQVEDNAPLDLSSADIVSISDSPFPHDSVPQSRRQPDGSFILDEVYSWEYRFSLSPLPSGSYLKSAQIGRKDVMDTPFTVHGGEHLDDLVFTVSLKAGMLTGIVQDETANPLPDAIVILQPDPRHTDRDVHVCSRTADQHGGFTCDNLAPGKYKIAAWRTPPEFPQAWDEIASRGTPVEVSESGRAAVVLNAQK